MTVRDFSPAAHVESAQRHISEYVAAHGRIGGVVGVSGGVDSSVTLALAAGALGPERVLAVALPERENTAASLDLARSVADRFGVEILVDDITSILDAQGCYAGRDEAVRQLGLSFNSDTDSLDVRLVQDIRGSQLPASYMVDVTYPSGEVASRRLKSRSYHHLFAFSNQKQRTRTTRLYFHAELRSYAVIGTSNFDETYLGFFVKLGDGMWDVCALDNLLKVEVFELAKHLGVPTEIVDRTTTTDTFPNGGQSQTEMFYGLTFGELDVLLHAMRAALPMTSVASELGWTVSEVENAVKNLKRRNTSTRWNRASPQGWYDPGSA